VPIRGRKTVPAHSLSQLQWPAFGSVDIALSGVWSRALQLSRHSHRGSPSHSFRLPLSINRLDTALDSPKTAASWLARPGLPT
jgi:hypothetical protein